MDAALARIEAVTRGKDVTVQADAPDGLTLHADRAAVEKMLDILLCNAVKFTAPGGRITIRTHNLRDYLRIDVQDTGCGIAPTAIGRLGKPFEQGDKRLANGMKGSGLGLAIARSLVDLHGGTLRIKSTLGLGTNVTIQLPRRDRSRVPAAA